MNKITYTAYLMFLFVAYIYTIAGVIPKEIAATFNIKDSDVVFAFTFFTIGTTSAIFINGILLDKLTPKREALVAFFLMITGMTGMILSHSIYIFSFFLMINGLGIGILVSFGNYLIINMYEKERAKKLNILNFYYSIGAVAGPFIAGYIIKYGKSISFAAGINRVWIYTYLVAIIGATVIFLLLITNDYSKLNKSNGKKSEEKTSEKWGVNVYIVAVAIFLYVMSEMTVNYWVVGYLQEKEGFSILSASKLLSVIWFFMMIGRFLSGKAVDYIKPEKYIIILGLIASMGVLNLAFPMNELTLWVAAAIIGIGYSGMYATILTYGTQQINEHSTKLMTFLITCGSAGSIISTPVSSIIKKNFGITSAIMVSFVAVFLSIVLITFTLKKKKI